MDVRAVSVAICIALPLSAQQFQFMGDRQRPSSVLPIADATYGFAAGDIDGDGDRDVVASDVNFVVIYRRENGAFVRSDVLSSSLGFPPGHRLLVRDSDGDGTVEVVAGPHGVAAELLLFHGITPISPLPGQLFHAFACDDVDNDGDLDFVLAQLPTSASTQGLLLLRQAFGALQVDVAALPAGQPAGTWPVFADVDADGDLDLVTVGASGGYRLFTNFFGVFRDATATLPTTGGGRHHAVAGDFDADGRTDIAALDSLGRIDVLWSTSTGFLYQPSGLGSSFTELEAGDIDNDGDADLVAFDSGFVLFRSIGNRSFSTESRAGDPTTRTGSGLADVDGDGVLDVLTAYFGSPGRVRCAYGGTLFEDAAAERGPLLTNEPEVAAPLAGDFNGDGRTDIVSIKDGAFDVQLAQGAGRYTTRRSTTVTGQILAAASGDFDRDGDLDIAMLMSLSLHLWANDGSANFTAMATTTHTSPAITQTPLAVGDFDRDGTTDFAFLTGTALLRVPGRLGNSWGQPVAVRTFGFPPARSFAVADFDRDGDLDLATSEPNGTGSMLLVNNGAAGFTPSPTPVPLPRASFSAIGGMAAGDVDNDNDADLFATDQMAGRPLLVLNQGNGTFVDASNTNMPATRPLPFDLECFIEDIDDDGDRDIVIAAGPLFTGVLVNTGNGQFLDRTTSRLGSVPEADSSQTATFADFDDDGDLDLAIAVDSRDLLFDHLRHLVTSEPPRLGQSISLTAFSGPGFGQNGLAFLAAAPNLRSAPLTLPGFAGKLELDPSTLLLLAIEPTDIVGVTQSFVTVPANPQLLGIDVFLQAAIVPLAGTPGFTNCVVERVRP